MTITLDSLILDVLEEHPESIEVFRRYGMGQIEEPAVRSLAQGASLQVAAAFVGLSGDQAASLVEELKRVVAGA